jgi:hypothetical protein
VDREAAASAAAPRLTTLSHVRRAAPLALVLVLAACGGSAKHGAATTTARSGSTTTARVDLTTHVLYQANGWEVAVQAGRAQVLRLHAGTYRLAPSGGVRIDILGPKPHSVAAAIPQIAAQFTAKTKLVEAGIWLDGVELPVSGGGIKPTQQTFYGAPASSLPPGLQRVVAYARTDTGGRAVTWTFTVK